MKAMALLCAAVFFAGPYRGRSLFRSTSEAGIPRGARGVETRRTSDVVDVETRGDAGASLVLQCASGGGGFGPDRRGCERTASRVPCTDGTDCCSFS